MNQNVNSKKNTNTNQIKQSPVTKRKYFFNGLSHLFCKWVYDWQPNFKFSQRFVSTQIVALVVLYHLFVTIFYFSFKIYFYLNDIIQSGFSPDGQTISTEIINFVKSFETSFYLILFLPLSLALVITLLQFFLAIKDSKMHLQQIYKGKCDYIPPRKELTNGFISGNIW